MIKWYPTCQREFQFELYTTAEISKDDAMNMQICSRPNLMKIIISPKDFFIWNEIDGTVVLRYSEGISQTRLILALDKAKYVQLLTRFSFDLKQATRFFDPASWAKFIEQYQDTALALIDMPRTRQRACWVHQNSLVERATYFLARHSFRTKKFGGRRRNSASDRSKEISSVKGPRETFYPIRACQTCG